MTAARTARRKDTRSHAAHRPATTQRASLRLTPGSQQPPSNGVTPVPLVQLSSNALLPVDAVQSCSPHTMSVAAKSP
jgi:hypothetical protein